MIPDYQTLMLPLLQLIADGKEYTLNEAVDSLARQFKLTDEERAELFQADKLFFLGTELDGQELI